MSFQCFMTEVLGNNLIKLTKTVPFLCLPNKYQRWRVEGARTQDSQGDEKDPAGSVRRQPRLPWSTKAGSTVLIHQVHEVRIFQSFSFSVGVPSPFKLGVCARYYSIRRWRWDVGVRRKRWCCEDVGFAQLWIDRFSPRPQRHSQRYFV